MRNIHTCNNKLLKLRKEANETMQFVARIHYRTPFIKSTSQVLKKKKD